MKEPKVSVIIPVYNTEKYVEECVNSVINQTYKNLEIILVNDGSNDNSLSVLNELKEKDSRIIVLDQENKGVSAARNLGLKHSTGEYIQFLDADDKMSPNKIESQINRLKGLNFDNDTISFCKAQVINDLGCFAGGGVSNNFPIWHDYTNPKEILIDMIISYSWFSTSGFLISKDLIDRSGWWNEQLYKSEDTEFFSRIFNNSKFMVFEPNSLVYYRNTPNSLSKQKSVKVIESWVHSVILVSEIIRFSNLPQSDLAIKKFISEIIISLYPYYKRARKEGERYIKDLYPEYKIIYPKLNWKEKIYYLYKRILNDPYI